MGGSGSFLDFVYVRQGHPGFEYARLAYPCDARQGHLGFMGKCGSCLDFVFVRQGHLDFVCTRQALPGFVTRVRDTWVCGQMGSSHDFVHVHRDTWTS